MDKQRLSSIQNKEKIEKRLAAQREAKIIKLPSISFEFSKRPTQWLPGCNFAGSITGHIAAYTEPSDGLKAVSLMAVHVKALELPREAGQRAKAKLSWPIDDTVYIAAKDAVYTTREVIFKEGHLWLSPGAAPTLQRAQQERAEALLSLDAEEGTIDYRRKVPCRSLTLESPQPRSVVTPEESEQLDHPVALFQRPGSTALGRVGSPFDTVKVLKRNGPWALIRSIEGTRGRPGLMYQGWIKASAFASMHMMTMGHIPRKNDVPPSHTVVRRTELLLQDQPTGLHLVQGVPVIALKDHNGLTLVAVAGVMRPEKEKNLWVRTEDLVEVN